MLPTDQECLWTTSRGETLSADPLRIDQCATAGRMQTDKLIGCPVRLCLLTATAISAPATQCIQNKNHNTRQCPQNQQSSNSPPLVSYSLNQSRASSAACVRQPIYQGPVLDDCLRTEPSLSKMIQRQSPFALPTESMASRSWAVWSEFFIDLRAQVV